MKSRTTDRDALGPDPNGTGLMIKELTQADQVLVSMYRLSAGKTSKLPYEEIVLQAWRDFPQSFSLRSHPEYPDASDIHKKIYQTLKPGGLVVSLGNKVFRLTDKGIEQASLLIRDGTSHQVTTASKARLSRAEQMFISHAMQSKPFDLWKTNQKQKLIDHDAKQFYQFSTGTPYADRQQKVRFADDAIDKAMELGIDGANSLHDLSEFLRRSFTRLIEGEA